MFTENTPKVAILSSTYNNVSENIEKMLELLEYNPVKKGILIKAKQRLKAEFGAFDFQSPVIPFNYTRYYERQMGKNLLRQFVSFKRLVNPGDLAKIKLYTNRLEQRFTAQFKEVSRPINLDPGYITSANLILASAKPFAHRLYLKRGIYAEVTLVFREKAYRPLEWTFPDYRTPEYIEVFNKIRELYRQQKSD